MRNPHGINQLRTGVLLSYSVEVVGIVSGLLYTPIMLQLLGKNEYGLYQTISSVVAYLSLIGLGFSSSYQRYYSRLRKKGTDQAIAGLNGMFLIVFCAMSLICVLCGSFLMYNLPLVFADGLTAAEFNLAEQLMLILIINMAITFPNSLFLCFIVAHEQFAFQKCIALITRIVNPILCIILLKSGYGSLGLVWVTLILSFFEMATNIIFCLYKLEMRISIKHMDFPLLKNIGGFTLFIFINQLVNQINWNVDKNLLGRFCGTSVVAVYSIGGQLRSYFSQFSAAISNAFIPRVNRLAANDNSDDLLSELFARVGRFQSYIVFLILTGFILFGKNFLNLWVGEEYQEAYIIAVMFFCVLTVPYIQNLGIEIQRAKNLHRIRAVVYAAMSIVNILISIPLIKSYGATGAAIGTVIAVAFCNILFMNYYYKVYVKLDIKRFWIQICPVAISSLILMGICLYLKRYVSIYTWLDLLLFIGIYSLLYGFVMYICVLNPNEKKSLLGIKRLLRR